MAIKARRETKVSILATAAIGVHSTDIDFSAVTGQADWLQMVIELTVLGNHSTVANDGVAWRHRYVLRPTASPVQQASSFAQETFGPWASVVNSITWSSPSVGVIRVTMDLLTANSWNWVVEANALIIAEVP